MILWSKDVVWVSPKLDVTDKIIKALSEEASDAVPAQEGLRLDEIVSRLGGLAEGDASVIVSQVGSLVSAGPGQIAFLVNPKYR